MAKRRDIDSLRDQVGTFDAPIGAVQLPATGVRLDKRGNPKALQSGQDEHPDPAPRGKRTRVRTQPEPELTFTTDLFDQDPAQRAVLTACHKLLAGRQVTSGELRRKLETKEFEADDVAFAIERCIANGLIDDVRYASAFVETRVRRGHGPARIRQDLAKRGVERSLVDDALLEHADAESLEEAAIEAARRKFARVDLADRAAEAKAFRWLMTRGYSSAHAGAAIRAVRQEQAGGLT